MYVRTRFVQSKWRSFLFAPETQFSHVSKIPDRVTFTAPCSMVRIFLTGEDAIKSTMVSAMVTVMSTRVGYI